jgi:hypothetical protein
LAIRSSAFNGHAHHKWISGMSFFTLTIVATNSVDANCVHSTSVAHTFVNVWNIIDLVNWIWNHWWN